MCLLSVFCTLVFYPQCTVLSVCTFLHSLVYSHFPVPSTVNPFWLYDHNTISFFLDASSLSSYKQEYVLNFLSESLSLKMQSKFHNCLALAQLIHKKKSTILFLCEHCASLDLLCVAMKNHLKCAECVCHDCSCISLLLEFLNHSFNKLKSELNAVLKEHEHLIAKISWLWKTLHQSWNLQDKKSLCLVQKLTNDNDETEDEALPDSLNFINSLLPEFWASIISTPPPQNVEAFSHSSWGSVWVPKLTLRYCILFTWQDSELSH